MDSTRARAGASSVPAVPILRREDLNPSCSMAPPLWYALMVRLTAGSPSMPIDEGGRARPWILVTAPRIPRPVSLSNFSSSLNPREGAADNRQWPPLGWRARVGQDDRLEASATVKGLRDPLLPIAGWGRFRPSEGALRAGPRAPCGDGGVGDRTLSSIGRAEPSGDCYSRLDREHRPTISLFTEDIAMTHAVLVLALSLSSQSQQAWPAPH